MLPAKTALRSEPKAETTISRAPAATPLQQVSPRLRKTAEIDRIRPPLRPVVAPPSRNGQNGYHFQARIPVITGEATYRGALPIDGLISGQMSANGGTLNVRQRPRSTAVNSAPELNGEISFKDLLRVNGHIAGKVLSHKGTLIIDAAAKVDADIEVAVAVIAGTVNGEVIGHERVELGSEAIINGSISTRLLEIKPGAIFQGDCRMIRNDSGDR
jgi:cytoskeletal protein CcmA (bactofilin family)